MIAPPLLADEARRLATLHHLNILDTAPEQRFDRLTRLAQRLFNVPMALVSLIDNDRQWIKSSAGLAAVQTPRNVSFCGHAIASDVTLVVPDACLDPRFHDNPFVAGEPHVRFYAGCPLVMPNGSRIGTLCVADSQPRDFDKNDVALLSDLARMVEQEICSVQLHSLDDLTGIASRRAFMGLAQKSLSQCCRLKLPASMLFFDLDGFKNINDCFGHGEGDRALSAFACLLRDTFCDSAVLGRMGGDEFAVLLWNCSATNAVAAVQRLQAKLNAYNRATARGYDICFSAGLAAADIWRRCVVEALLAEADDRMYEQKRSKSLMHLVA
jgi:diguanylate cyclase (GGDEF)-like protein